MGSEFGISFDKVKEFFIEFRGHNINFLSTPDIVSAEPALPDTIYPIKDE
jgi:hypothetical protein